MLGIDLQQISIASLIIALGLLVDDPVVAGDAIKRDLDHGHPPVVAAWLGPTKLAHAILFATITNIVAYLPFLMLSGATGQFLFSLPVVLACSLVASRHRLDDVHPAAGLLPAAAEPEGHAADRGAPAEGVYRVVLPARPPGDRAPLAVRARLARRPGPGRLDHEPAQAPVLPQGSPVPVLRRGLAAGGRAAHRDPGDHRAGRGGRPRITRTSTSRSTRGPTDEPGRPGLAHHLHGRRRAALLVQLLARAAADQLRAHRASRLAASTTPRGWCPRCRKRVPARSAARGSTCASWRSGPPVGMPVSIRLSGDHMPTLRALDGRADGDLPRGIRWRSGSRTTGARRASRWMWRSIRTGPTWRG